MGSNPEREIEAAASALEVRLPAGVPGRLHELLQLLLAWNERINLTGARTLQALVEEHLPDALALARLVPLAARLVDVGSGGGLPALPLALIRPDVRLSLVEPRAKRVAFLRTATRVLGIEATLHAGRVEELGPGLFDVACSRATFSPEEWWRVGRALVQAGGRVVFFLGGAREAPAGLPVGERVEYRAGRGRIRIALSAIVPRGTT